MKPEKIDEYISQAAVSYMSNAKWKKLFSASAQFGKPIGGVIWKLVGSDSTFNSTLCVADCVEGDRFGDCLPSPYLELREIDCLFIPHFYENPKADPKRPLPKLENDLEGFKNHLSSFGQFPIFDVAEGFVIRGYEWQSS